MKTRSYSILLILILLLFGCQQNVPVPPDLQGVWTTATPQYEGRYLSITEDSLIFGIGEGEVINNILEKKIERENNMVKYTFRYENLEGEQWTLSLFYNPISKRIQLQNRNEFWERIHL